MAITISLTPEIEAKLHARAMQQGQDVNTLAAELLTQFIEWEQQDTEEAIANLTYDPNAIPIWELAAQLSATVPDEEWAKLPTDLARNFDHYQQQRNDS